MALVRKILEATIPLGGSSATFTDSDIPNSLIRVYSTNSNIYPQNISLTGNTLTVSYETVTSALGVAVELVKQGLEIDDNLTSDNTDHALSAKQGKVLKGLIDAIPTGITELSELDDVEITDIEDGQVLAWDEVEEKFINVDQSGGSSAEIIKASWTTTTSTSAYTPLTESKTLNAGKYIVNIHNAYSTSTNINQFCLLINDSADLSSISNVNISYGNSTFIIELTQTSSVCFASASGTSMSWDSQYLSRGGMNILKIG